MKNEVTVFIGTKGSLERLLRTSSVFLCLPLFFLNSLFVLKEFYWRFSLSLFKLKWHTGNQSQARARLYELGVVSLISREIRVFLVYFMCYFLFIFLLNCMTSKCLLRNYFLRATCINKPETTECQCV